MKTIRIIWASAFIEEFFRILKATSKSKVKRWFYTDSIYGQEHLDAIVEVENKGGIKWHTRR